ncbi:hypothetical protein [Streptococcus azizii]
MQVLYQKSNLVTAGYLKIFFKNYSWSNVENGNLVHTSEQEREIRYQWEQKIVAIWNATKKNYLENKVPHPWFLYK